MQPYFPCEEGRGCWGCVGITAERVSDEGRGCMSGTLLIVLLALLWAALVTFLRVYRIWLPYYMVGAAGAAYWLVVLTHKLLNTEPSLAYSVAWVVHHLMNVVNVPTRIFDGAPGMLLVMVITQQVGWTALQIGVESSGLLEMSVFTSLVLFYPGWSWQRRATICLAGIAATWAANIVRMVVITYMLHALGKEALVLAHTYVGKALFFALTIGIYWYLITGPTLRGLNEGLMARRRS